MRAAVLGHPVAHSLSPAMHRAAYERLRLDWTYDAIDVDTPDLERLLAQVPDDVRGYSVTAPLKRRLVELADEVVGDAETLGVGNTVLFDDGRRVVHNTDVPGAVAALARTGVTSLESVRIIGGGATAASLLLAASRLGAARAEMCVRAPERAAGVVALAERLGMTLRVREPGEPLVDVVDLLVSTVPADVAARRADDHVDAARAVFDAIYDPWPTRLAALAERASRPLVSGLDLLAHQAALQVELMTGRPVDAAVLRAAALAALDRS